MKHETVPFVPIGGGEPSPDGTDVFRPEAQAKLRKIPRDMALRILTELETDPLGFNTTALASQPERRRLRIGDYRVVYTINNGELVVRAVHVGHRSTVYES